MAIRWDRLTVKAAEAIQGAATHATDNGNPEVLPLHLIAALLEDRRVWLCRCSRRSVCPCSSFFRG